MLVTSVELTNTAGTTVQVAERIARARWAVTLYPRIGPPVRLFRTHGQTVSPELPEVLGRFHPPLEVTRAAVEVLNHQMSGFRVILRGPLHQVVIPVDGRFGAFESFTTSQLLP